MEIIEHLFEDVDQKLIDQEFDGMANDGSSEPMTDLDFESPQPANK